MAEEKIGPTKDGKVGVKLAHPLPERDLLTLGLKVGTPHNVGDVVEVSKNHAITLIGAGMAQVDPENHAAVTAALTGDREPAATEGQIEGVADLKGDSLEQALDTYGLSHDGNAAEKRQRISDHLAANA